MKEIIIVAGENRSNVTRLRHCLRDENYSSILCETVEEIIEELGILPTCSVYVPLVLIESEILKNISDELINRLSECAPEVPFILLGEQNSPETFEQICAHRSKFEWEGNLLANVLEGTGVELTCG